jgi:hypothetical protein
MVVSIINPTSEKDLMVWSFGCLLSFSLLHFCFVFLLYLLVFLGFMATIEGYAFRDGMEELLVIKMVVVSWNSILVRKRNERDNLSSLFVFLCFFSLYFFSLNLPTHSLFSLTPFFFFFCSSIMPRVLWSKRKWKR